MTAEELLRLPDVDGRHELIAGELITLSFGGMARGLAGMVIGRSLGRYVEEHALGVTVTSCGFQLAWNPDTVLGAAFAFVAAPRAIHTDDYYAGAPDLAIEVVNFDETCADMVKRANQWIAAGTRLAIVVDPENEVVVVMTPNDTMQLTKDDIVTGSDVVPGWSIPVRDIFA